MDSGVRFSGSGFLPGNIIMWGVIYRKNGKENGNYRGWVLGFRFCV